MGYAEGNIPLRNIEGVGSVAGGTLPAQDIWHEFMDVALKNVPPTAWSLPRTAPEFAPFASRWASYGYVPPAPVTPTPEETEPEETAPEETVPADTVPADTLPVEPVPEDTLPVEPVPEDTGEEPAFTVVE